MAGIDALGAGPIGDSGTAAAQTITVMLGNAGGAIASRTGLAVHVFAAPNMGAANATGADGKLVVDVTALGLSGAVYAVVLDPATGEHWSGSVAVV